MGLIDRFTRDEVSAKVWWPLALLFFVLAVATFRLENRAADERRTEAAVWSAAAISGPLAASLDPPEVSRPLDADEADVVTGAMPEVVSVDAVDAVRIWSVDGTLLYSSREGDLVGSQEALNDAELRDTSRDPSTSLSVIAERSSDGSTDPLFVTYAVLPGSSSTIGEVQLDEARMLADISSTWLGLRLLFGGSALLVLALALLTMREPIAKIGAGVRFYPTSVPASLVVMDREEEVALRQAGAHARRRSESVDRRIEELEASKLALEGELQRALSALAALRAAKGGTTRAIPPAPVAPTPSAPEPTEPVVRVPGSLAPIDLGTVEPVAEPGPPALRAVPSPEPEPEPSRVPEATRRRKEKRRIVEAQRRPEPEPAPPPQPAPEPEPQPAPEPEPQPAPQPVPQPAPEPVPPPRPAPEPEPAPAPEPVPTPVIEEVRATAPEPEPAKVEPAKVEPAKVEPAKVEPAKVEPAAAQSEPVVVASDPLMDLVVLPEVEPVAARKSAPPPAAKDDAVDVLNRLVAPTAPPAGTVDPGEIRAKLARTAALKKPGSRERREEQERKLQNEQQQPPR